MAVLDRALGGVVVVVPEAFICCFLPFSMSRLQGKGNSALGLYHCQLKGYYLGLSWELRSKETKVLAYGYFFSGTFIQLQQLKLSHFHTFHYVCWLDLKMQVFHRLLFHFAVHQNCIVRALVYQNFFCDNSVVISWWLYYVIAKYNRLVLALHYL